MALEKRGVSLIITGCASLDALLAWPVLALRCGWPEAALAAAQQAAAAKPASAPVQRQALVVQAQQLTLQVRIFHDCLFEFSASSTRLTCHFSGSRTSEETLCFPSGWSVPPGWMQWAKADSTSFLQITTAASDVDRRALLRRLEEAALAATAGVGGSPEAAPMWVAALEALAAAGAPRDKLLDALAVACLGQASGPVRVGA